MMGFQEIYLEIYNLLRSLLVSSIILIDTKIWYGSCSLINGDMGKNPDKAKPSVRRGRKAAGLDLRWPSCRRVNLFVTSAFSFCRL